MKRIVIKTKKKKLRKGVPTELANKYSEKVVKPKKGKGSYKRNK